jgi:hypothetical protein
MNNTISHQDITLFKAAKDAALRDIKQEEKRVFKQLETDNCLFDTVKLIQNEKSINPIGTVVRQFVKQ